MGDNINEHSDIKNGIEPKRPSKIRDLFTDRIVGIISGAFIPLVLLFIPLINKYLDNTKEIQTLQLQSNTEDIETINQRMNALTNALVNSQLQFQAVTTKLATTAEDLKSAIIRLEDCQRSLHKKG